MSWSNSRAVGDFVARGPVVGLDTGLLDELSFHRLIAIERKRSERSGNKFALILVNIGSSLPSGKSLTMLANIARALSVSVTDTDVIGWYRSNHVIAVMFTEIAPDEKNAVLTTLLDRVICALRDQLSEIGISAHLYPDTWEHELDRRPSNPIFYPDLAKRAASRWVLLFWLLFSLLLQRRSS
jgi:hypothetical protein